MGKETYYNEISRGYEELHREEQEKKLKIIKQHIKPKKEEKLLDVGCGTGYFLKAVEKKVEAYGIDFSKESVKIAKKIATKSKISSGKVENLKFKDRFFDYVVSLGCLQYFPDMEKNINRFVYGSDWPGIKAIDANIEAIKKLPLAEESKRKILYGNAARILGLK